MFFFLLFTFHFLLHNFDIKRTPIKIIKRDLLQWNGYRYLMLVG